MIVTRLDGGLGNQMFQYAFGLFLAELNGTQLALDCSPLDRDRLRSYMLDRMAIDAPQTSEELRRMFPRRYGGKGWRLVLSGKVPMKRVREKPFGFRSTYLTCGDNVYLDGYWQSERFFPNLRKRLLGQFQPAQSVHPTTAAIAHQMDNASAVSLHVRRGDYAQNQAILERLGLCSIDYYQRCINDLLGHYDRLRIFVFSDDHGWCRQHLNFGCPTTHVDHNGATDAHEDIWLMTRCRHHVVANSSFSWWGAWLRQSEEGVVYAPEQWFQDPKMNTEWIVPSDWRRISGSNTCQKAA